MLNAAHTVTTADTSCTDEPYVLKCPAERQRRKEMLALPHVSPLAEYLDRVQEQASAEFGRRLDMPCFDPCDGGVDARALFLLETPGPKAVGSEFISRNNPDPTARNMCHLMEEARIPRGDTLLWNIVPWYVPEPGEAKPKSKALATGDVSRALPYLGDLLGLLPQLQVIVLVGLNAQSAERQIRLLSGARIEKTYHMAAKVWYGMPEKRAHIRETFGHVGRLLREAHARGL